MTNIVSEAVVRCGTQSLSDALTRLAKPSVRAAYDGITASTVVTMTVGHIEIRRTIPEIDILTALTMNDAIVRHMDKMAAEIAGRSLKIAIEPDRQAVEVALDLLEERTGRR